MSIGPSTEDPRRRDRKAHEKTKSDWERMLECMERAARKEDCDEKEAR